ncbi:MAG: lipocalin family protein [Desulfobacteraceae bacterium]
MKVSLPTWSIIPICGLLLTGCQSFKPIETVSHVDIERFMGSWFVIANIPTFIEKDAYNAVESYRLDDDGTIATTFTFNKGGFDGPEKKYTPRGFIRDPGSNAVWGMQFVWPFKAEYRIVYLDADYNTTVIGRTKRDYVWVMARSRTIGDDQYNEILNFLASQGYDIHKIQRVPQIPGTADSADNNRLGRRKNLRPLEKTNR